MGRSISLSDGTNSRHTQIQPYEVDEMSEQSSEVNTVPTNIAGFPVALSMAFILTIQYIINNETYGLLLFLVFAPVSNSLVFRTSDAFRLLIIFCNCGTKQLVLPPTVT